MTHSELVARAKQRAQEQGVRVYNFKGTVLSPSLTTKPGEMWELTVDRYGNVSCSCPGFTYRQSCKHVEAYHMQQETKAKEELKRQAAQDREDIYGSGY